MQDENAPENIDDMPVEDTEQLESNAGTDGLSSQLQDAEERVLRAQAEIENVRKRGRREYEDLLRYGEMNLLRDILPVLDNIERAIEASESTTDVETLREGFRMTASQIEKLLESHGCETIKTENEVFDPTVHEAISQQPGNGADPGTVIGVTSRGYVLHDRVVRPAQVVVAANE
ncbi:MAG TPA: nucleotide exchange factor GrpE [Planctomycetaceae bacterium]|jgi:molecular chaperone GrpE|nr:nucleotide exchange factor GrpE [Planctomycetaceae bacterium]HAU49489.1 nucleotide exchange factor GrpE [Planctomycetaceae bacterium]HBK74638.1 nucleotide exchange factor GrpE [Planctomycetaceae bacterium]HBP82667.1 nucleotide exchange factor GrpE [Planctomycetaceae bacterium]|tara:strand:- start:4378 stop:4902 length:525 start_codon:yes stop_codon:yes gene_type:complete